MTAQRAGPSGAVTTPAQRLGVVPGGDLVGGIHIAVEVEITANVVVGRHDPGLDPRGIGGIEVTLGVGVACGERDRDPR